MSKRSPGRPIRRACFYVVEDRGRTAVRDDSCRRRSFTRVITGASNIGDVQFAPDGKTMIYSEQTGTRPTRCSGHRRAAARQLRSKI